MAEYITKIRTTEGDKRISTRIDVTDDYVAWTPESGIDKTVLNFAKTLDDGDYTVVDNNAYPSYYRVSVFSPDQSSGYRVFIAGAYQDGDYHIEAVDTDGFELFYIDGVDGESRISGDRLITQSEYPIPLAADEGKVLVAGKFRRVAWKDTAPLYITLTYDNATKKWVPDVNYTSDDIIAALNSRQVIVKVIATEQVTLYAPVTQVINTGSNRVVFGAVIYGDPTDLSMHWFVTADCYDSGAWDVVLDDQN